MHVSQQNISFTGNVADILTKNKEVINKKIVPAAIVGILGVQTASDIKHAQKEDKKNVLINNLLIGVAMAAGGYLSHLGIKKFLNMKTAKEYFEALSIPIGAGLAGGITGEVAQRCFPIKEDKRRDILEKADLITSIDYDSINKVMNIDTLGATKSIDGTFSTMIGYTIGKEKGIKNKVKKFVFEIIGGAAIPLAFVLSITKYLNKTKPQNRKTNAGIILGAGIVASFAGKFMANMLNRKVTDRVVESKIWEELSKKQKELAKWAIFVKDPVKKEEIITQVKKIKDAKEQLKEPEEKIKE